MDQFQPKTWDSYIGQEKLKDFLQIKIEGSMERMEPLAHILLMGPPGCGKSSLAGLIAQELESEFLEYIMPIKPAVLKKIVQHFQGVVLLDELHRMPTKQQEDMLSLLQFGYLQLDNGAKIYSGNLTVVGATTKPKKIDEAIWDRFIRPSFEEYSDQDMARIILGMAKKVNLDMPKPVALRLSRACGGMPRNAKALVEMSLDLKSFETKLILEKCQLTKDGLTADHLKYLHVLSDVGIPVGVELLGAHLQQPSTAIVDLERLLLKRGMIEYTKQGRALTGAGYKALGTKINFNF